MNKSKGFTLIELLVVIAIIGILAVVILAALGTAQKSARDAKKKEAVRNVMTAIETYSSINGDYPTGLDDLVPQFVAEVPAEINKSKFGAGTYCVISDEFEAKAGHYFYAKDGVVNDTENGALCD